MNNLKVNKSNLISLPLVALVFAGLSLSNASFANDITHDLRNNTQEVSDAENYLEIGLMYVQSDEPIYTEDNKASYGDRSIIINGSYNWHNLFVESYSESGHGLVFGFNAYASNNWSLDVIVTTDMLDFDFEFSGKNHYIQRPGTSKPLTLGSRLTGYLGENVVQFSVNQDATGNHNGTTVTALIGQSWQYRNWNFHGTIGVEYASAKLNDYYVGVSEELAAYVHSLGFNMEAYKAGSSVGFTTEIGVTYPITEDWVFRATARTATRPSAVTNSPIYSNLDSSTTSIRTSLSYVF